MGLFRAALTVAAAGGLLLVYSLQPAGAAELASKFLNGFCQERFDAANADAYGIDVSKWQGDIDWAKINTNTGVLYTFLRSSYGITADPDFQKNWKGAGEECLLRGIYHYYVEKDEAQKQAIATFAALKAANALSPDFPIVADIERSSATDEICTDEVRAKSFTKKVNDFVEAFEKLIGQKMMIYTNNSFWACLTKVAPSDTAAIAKGRDLWIAEYTEEPAPVFPKEWRTWRFWQFHNKGRVAGIKGPIDANRFNGSGAKLLEYVKAR